MANITEQNSYDANIYLIATTDPVVGGENGVSNMQAKGLANRTNWLKSTLESLITAYNSFVTTTNQALGSKANSIEVYTQLQTDQKISDELAAYAYAKADVYTKAEMANELTKEIEIGAWNMDTTAAVEIDHGLTNSKIRSLEVLIANDSNTVLSSLISPIISSGVVTLNGGYGIFNGKVQLNRLTGGFFDNGSYVTAANRGYIRIKHIA